MEAVDILDEACQEESFLEAVVLQQPHLAHLGEKGASLLTRFFSVKRGYSLMSRLGYIDRAINMWFKVKHSTSSLSFFFYLLAIIYRNVRTGSM